MLLRFTHASSLYWLIGLVQLGLCPCMCLMRGQSYHWETWFVLSRRYNSIGLDHSWRLLIDCWNRMLMAPRSAPLNNWQGKSSCLMISLEQILLDWKLLQHELYLSMPRHGASIWVHLLEFFDTIEFTDIWFTQRMLLYWGMRMIIHILIVQLNLYYVKRKS